MREKHVITNGFTEKQTKWKGSVVAMRLTGLLRHDTELLRLLASNKATVCNLLGENGAYKMPGEMARRSTRFMAGIWVLSLALSGEHGRPCKTAFLLSSSPSLQEAGGGGRGGEEGPGWSIFHKAPIVMLGLSVSWNSARKRKQWSILWRNVCIYPQISLSKEYSLGLTRMWHFWKGPKFCYFKKAEVYFWKKTL